jgi:hypothetical protein
MNNSETMSGHQSAEDKAINARIAARLGTWDFGDRTQPARRSTLREYARAMTARRVAFKRDEMPQMVAIHACGWESPL